MLKGVVWALLICLLTSAWAQAQLAVADAPVLAAVGSVAVTLKTMLDEIRRQVESLANWGAILAELQAIAQLLADVEALITEVQTLDQGWTQLVDSGSLLCSIDAIVAWKGQALTWQQRGFAITRTANRLLGRTMNVLRSLYTVLAGILGPTGGSQSASAILALMAANMQQLQAATGSFQSALLGPDLMQSVLGIQMVCLHGTHLSDWGSYSR